GLAKEPLGRGRISSRSQKEIDRLPSAVHRPIEIRPASLHPNVGFVHPPGAVAHSQMRASSLFKLHCVGLDPSEDRRVVDLDSAVEEHEFQIAVADREHQIPSHGPKDRLSCELPPLEAITQTHTDARPIVPPQSYGKSASSKVCNRTSGFGNVLTQGWLVYQINPRWAVAAGAQAIAPTSTNGVASDAWEEVT